MSASPTDAVSPETFTSSKSRAARRRQLDSIDEVYRIAAKARDNTRSMGVAIAAGSIPETGALTFELGPDEIEIGMGAHGEPGISRQKLTTADAIAEQMMDAILPDLPFRSGDEVALLINNLGATTMMELLVVNRCVRQDSGRGGDCSPSHRYRLAI